MQEQNQKPPEFQEPAEGAPHSLVIVFAGKDSAKFDYRREGVTPWQLAGVAETLRIIAELEISNWHMEFLARQMAAKPKIAVPGMRGPM